MGLTGNKFVAIDMDGVVHDDFIMRKVGDYYFALVENKSLCTLKQVEEKLITELGNVVEIDGCKYVDIGRI